jgi:hypothetical protein
VLQGAASVDYVVPLRGAGDALGLQTDVWRQDANPKADVLLVIDNSCSMDDDQMALASNLATFIAGATFSSVGVDFHIGVTITELSDPARGELIGDATNPKVLTRSTPMLQQLFADKVIVGTNGGWEGIVEPAVRAVTPPLVVNENAGFLRDDAMLAIIGISDEPDQSIGVPGAPTAAFFAARLLAVKNNRAHLISYNVIGPSYPANGICPIDDPPATSFDQFLTGFFHGVRGEICMADWATLLADVAKPSFGYRDTFYLSTDVDFMAGGLTVKIDQGDGMGLQTLPPMTAAGVPIWRYDALSNAVVFEPSWVPAPGTVLEISYPGICH